MAQISKAMEDKLNEQIKNEMYSANIYMAMAINFDDMGLKGFSDFMYKQAKEEQEHAEKFMKYMLDVGSKPRMSAIPEPKNDYSGGTEMISAALDHEKKVSAMINDLVRLAREENDYATQNMLQWFVEEQVEEEASFDEILKLCEKAGDDKLFMVQAMLKRSD